MLFDDIYVWLLINEDQPPQIATPRQKTINVLKVINNIYNKKISKK
jgi:hypothetical protein